MLVIMLSSASSFISLFNIQQITSHNTYSHASIADIVLLVFVVGCTHTTDKLCKTYLSGETLNRGVLHSPFCSSCGRPNAIRKLCSPNADVSTPSVREPVSQNCHWKVGSHHHSRTMCQHFSLGLPCMPSVVANGHSTLLTTPKNIETLWWNGSVLEAFDLHLHH